MENDFNVEDIVRIGPDLDAEFRRQAATYARVGQKLADARADTRRLKSEFDLVYAQLYNDEENTGGVELRKQWVIVQKAYQAKDKQLRDAQYVEDSMQAVVRAMEHKRDALMNLGANSRHEMDPETRILVEHVKKRFKG